MAKIKEIAGKKYRDITVIKDSGKRTKKGSVLWECRTDDGQTILKQKYELDAYLKQSKRYGKNSKGFRWAGQKELLGKKFGRLTVVKRTTLRTRGSILYNCDCDCGNTILVSSTDLKRANTQSCGCLQREAASKNMTRGKYNEICLVEQTNISLLDSKIPISNTSGVKGVYWGKKAKKWIAQIRFQRKTIYLGSFANKQDAINARKEAEEKYFEPILEKYGKKQLY